MTSQKTLRFILAALMAAMTCIATMAITIPTPTNGYIHLGDGLVLLCGIILGPVYGGLAAGIGSLLSDLLLGYAYYALPTLLIKSAAAALGGLAYRKAGQSFQGKKNLPCKNRLAPLLFAGISQGAVVTAGYFLAEAALFGQVAAACAGVPGNLLQNLFGILVSAFLLPALSHVPTVRDLMAQNA